MYVFLCGFIYTANPIQNSNSEIHWIANFFSDFGKFIFYKEILTT